MIESTPDHHEGSLTDLLQLRYDKNEWFLIPQVRNRPGFGGGSKKVRTADALALGIWES